MVSNEELMLLNCGVGENSWEIQPVHPKGNQSWIFIGKADAEAETPILWPPDAKNWLIGKDPDAGKDWRQERGQQRMRWMALLTRWTWVWVNSGIWWWTGSPGMLQSMGLQRVGHDWVTELNWTFSLKKKKVNFCNSLGCFLLALLKGIIFYDEIIAFI